MHMCVLICAFSFCARVRSHLWNKSVWDQALEEFLSPQLVHLIGAAASLVSASHSYQSDPSPPVSVYRSEVTGRSAAGYQRRIHCSLLLT